MTITSNVESRYLAEAGEWEILEPVVFTLPSGHTIEVPAGFRTDGASVPRLFQNLFPRISRYFAAAVVHDWLYRHGGRVDWQPQALGKRASDRVFFLAILACGVRRCVALPMYAAVRIGGGKSFQGIER